MMVRAAAVVLAGAGLVGTFATAHASTYRVGIGEQFRELTALPPLMPGDVVEVVGGFTYQPVKLEADGTAAQPIVIRGLRNAFGKRPLIDSGDNGLELAGDHYVVEGFELAHAAVRCLFVHADGIVLRDLLIHDCTSFGIEGGVSGGGDLTLEYSELHDNGRGLDQDQVSVATDEIMHPGARFRMRFNYLHDGKGGNNVKSRAERNEIYFNWIEGALYYELELIGPDSAVIPENQAIENSDVVGNVLAKGGGHSTSWITRIGGDGTGQTYGRYRFAYNTVILASDSAGAFRLFDGIDTFEAHNNVIHRTSTAATTPVIVRESDATWRPSRALVGSHNWVVDAIVDGVPAATDWTGTIRGADPGWNGFGDYRPLEGSPLVDAADPAPAGVPGRPFPMPLPEPSFEPPVAPTLGRAPLPGEEHARARVGTLDIGAFELGMGPPVDPDAGVGPGDGDGGVDDGDGGTNGGGNGGGCCQTGRAADSAAPLALALLLGLRRRKR